MRRLARGASSLVGLGQEAYAHHKEKNEGVTSNEEFNTEVAVPGGARQNDEKTFNEKGYTEDEVDEVDDEDEWSEDEAQMQLQPTESGKKLSSSEIVEELVQNYPAPTVRPAGKLPAPVMVPSRRPGSSLRGFVRAYPPAISSSGVDPDAFLRFLDGMQRSMDGQGGFNVANLAFALSVIAYTAQFGPSVIVHFSAMAVHTSIEASRRMYINTKRSSYLDKMNERFFQPRGLFALLMKYDPSKANEEVVDFDTAVGTAVSKRDDPERSKAKDLINPTAGKTLDAQMPEVCPLTYPDRNDAGDQDNNAFKRAMAFSSDYYDRRAQAVFKQQNPESELNVEQKPFAGSHGDPTKFQNSGAIGMLTGGRIDRGQRKWERQNQKRIRQGKEPLKPGQRGGRVSGLLRNTVGTVRRSLSEGVIYLLVVNMPTEDELARAAEVQARIKKENPKWYEQFRF